MVVNGVIFQNFPPRGTLKGIAEKLPQNSPEKHPWSRPFLAILLLESVSRLYYDWPHQRSFHLAFVEI